MKNTVKKLIIISICSLFLQSCALNSEQERSLNIHISKYIDSINSCQILGLVGYTYPEFIQELTSNNDTVFVKFFNCMDDKKYFSNPTIRSTVKREKQIHVLFEMDEGSSSKKEKIVSITADNGTTWYFLPYCIYQDKSNCKSLIRLL